MLRRGYLIILLVAVFGVSAAFSQSASAYTIKQKDKADKEKAEKAAKADKAEKPEQNKYKEGSESLLYAPMPAVAFPLTVGESGYLGVYLEEVTSERAKELRLAEERGAIVMKVIEGSPADKAGLKANDVIIAFNGRRVDSVRELQRFLGDTPAGRTVSFEVTRNGSNQTLSATMTRRTPHVFRTETPEWNKRSEEMARRAEEMARSYSGRLRVLPELGNFRGFESPGTYWVFRGTRLGIGVESLSEQLGEYFGAKKGEGVLITEVHENGPAAKAGLKAGDVIIEVDNEKVESVNGLVTSINRKAEGTVTLKVLRNRAEQTITVNLERAENPTTPAPRRRARTV